MSASAQDRGAAALNALLASRTRFTRIEDGDFSAAVVQLARKQLNAKGQKAADLRALRDAIGDDLFETTLKSLTPYHLRLLARRLDKKLPQEEIASGAGALSHVKRLLALSHTPLPEKPDAPEAAPIEPAEAAPAAKNSYFGRKAFRAGD